LKIIRKLGVNWTMVTGFDATNAIIHL